MNPLSCDAAKSTRSLDATSMRFEAESLVQTISAPRSSAMRSASRLTDTGSATRAPGPGLDDEGQRARASACSVPSAWPASSTSGPGLAVGVDHHAQVGLPEARTRSPIREIRASMRSSVAPFGRVAANGFTASTSAPIFASTAGMTSDAAPNE